MTKRALYARCRVELTVAVLLCAASFVPEARGLKTPGPHLKVDHSNSVGPGSSDPGLPGRHPGAAAPQSSGSCGPGVFRPRALGGGAERRPAAAPCAACIVLVASPGQSLLIAGPLNGARDTRRDDRRPRRGGRRPRRPSPTAGGRPGLVLTSARRARLAARARPCSIVSPSAFRSAVRALAPRASLDEGVFRLKTQLVDIRSAAPRGPGRHYHNNR